MCHQTQHQNDLPCGCYICQDGGNGNFVCDYVFPDTKIACGHREVCQSFLNVHRSKYSHNVFEPGRRQYQCDGCGLIFEYWAKWHGHQCSNLSKRNMKKYPPPVFKIPPGYNETFRKVKG